MVVDAQSFDAGAEHLLTSIHGRFIIAGTAYGGCLAIETAIRAPERVAGLWLMNCNPGAHPDLDAVRETSFRLRSGQLDQVLDPSHLFTGIRSVGHACMGVTGDRTWRHPPRWSSWVQDLRQ